MPTFQWIKGLSKRNEKPVTGDDGGDNVKVHDVTIKDDLVLDNDDEDYGKPCLLDPDGWYRVKRLYRDIARNAETAEAGMVNFTFATSLYAGFFFGTTIGVIPTYQDFKVRFNEYQFQGKSQYARRLLDCTLMACFRNGVKMAWRACLLSTLLTTTTATFAVYHDDIRFTDMMLALGLTGGLYRFQQGPKGMFSGFVLFSLFGIPLAIAAKTAFWASGMTYQEFSQQSREYFDSRDVKKAKRNQRGEARWREASMILNRDYYKGYLYHQRRVDRLENMGIVDEDFENIKPTKIF